MTVVELDGHFLGPDAIVQRYGALGQTILELWRTRGDGPGFIEFCGRALYPLSQVLAWERERSC
jgi:hypothetical protein